MRLVKNISLALIIIVVAWNSLYFAKLDDIRASKAGKEFDATKYANEFWNKKLIPNVDKAVDILELPSLIKSDKTRAFDSYSHALGIGNLRYFLVKGNGAIERVESDYVVIDLNDSKFRLATEYIFGNAVRDASGLVDINDFANTMDFNNVSAEINKIIREQVLPSFKENIRNGDKLEFVGAVELNKEHVNLKNIEIIPIQLKIVR